MEPKELALAWFGADIKWAQDYINVLKTLKEPVPQIVFLALENGEELFKIAQTGIGEQSTFKAAVGNLILYEDILYISTLGKLTGIDMSSEVAHLTSIRKTIWPEDKNILAKRYLPYIIPFNTGMFSNRAPDIETHAFNANAMWANDLMARGVDIYYRYHANVELIEHKIQAIMLGTITMFERYRLAIYVRNAADLSLIKALMNADADGWDDEAKLIDSGNMQKMSLQLKR